jgi:hypothetical protein
VPVDADLLSDILDHSEEAINYDTLANKRNLLHRLVKEVRIRSRGTIEVWYALPTPARFEDWRKWLPGVVSQSVILWDIVDPRMVPGCRRHTEVRLLSHGALS